MTDIQDAFERRRAVRGVVVLLGAVALTVPPDFEAVVLTDGAVLEPVGLEGAGLAAVDVFTPGPADAVPSVSGAPSAAVSEPAAAAAPAFKSDLLDLVVGLPAAPFAFALTDEERVDLVPDRCF